MQLYTEIALGAPQNRGQVIKTEEIEKFITIANQNPNYKQLYTSYYRFDESLVEHIETHKTIKGYDGPAYLSSILLDIDRTNDDDSIVLDKTREFVNDLSYGLEIPEEWIIPWFSGTGYHVCLPNIFGLIGDKDLPRVLKNTINHYLPTGHDNIYDKSRLIRAPYTINTKSGLFKIPLTTEELYNLSYEEIFNLAGKKETFNELFRTGIPVNPPFIDEVKFKPIHQTNTKTKSYNRGTELSDELITPNQIAPCIQELYSRGPQTGGRRNTLLRIISYYRRNGLLYSAAKAIAKDWCSMGEGFDVNEAMEITDYIYFNDRKYTCFDSLMDANCKESCLYYHSKKKGNDPLIPVYTYDQMNEKYFEIIKERKNYPGMNLKTIMNLTEDYWVRPKELVSFMGDSGAGKTGFLQNTISLSGAKTLWLCLEFRAELLFRRFRQLIESKSSNAVDDNYYGDLPPEYNADGSFIKFVDVSPNILGLKRLVCEEVPQVLVIDTIDCIKGDHYGGNQKAKLDETILALRDIAERQNIIVIGVSHIPKSESDRVRQTGGSLNMHSGMGTASIAQKSDHVWALDGVEGSTNRRFYITKGRDNSKFMQTFNFDWNTFKFTTNPTEQFKLSY